MFLVIKELKYIKGKFVLIIFVIVLISYLVYFLILFVYGLVLFYINVVNKWGLDEVVIIVDFNDLIMMLFMINSDFEFVEVDGIKVRIGLFLVVINNLDVEVNVDLRLNVYFFGIDNDFFLKFIEVSNLII